MVYEMNLKKIYFDMIKNGKKIYEIRLNDEKRRQLDVGDIIIFRSGANLEESIKTEIKDLIVFSSFKEMASTLPLEKVGFANISIEDTVKVYYQFYSKELEEKYGVLAIKIEVLS